MLGQIVGTSHLLMSITFFVMSVFQFFAIMEGLHVWLGLHWIIAILLAFITAGIPIVGTVIGMCGAVYAWGWSWGSAFLLFCGPFIAVFIIAWVTAFIRHSK